jgi:PAS domain S-box-containing protein
MKQQFSEDNWRLPGEVEPLVPALQSDLDQRLPERLADLTATNQALVAELAVRARVEIELREGREHYRELFENAQDAIYLHDLQGNYLSANHAAEKLTGFSSAEIIGRNFREFMAPEYVQLISSSMSRKLENEAPTTYEIEVQHKDGRRVPVEVSSRLIYEQGVPVGVQGMARDITERKRAEAERQALAEIVHGVITTVSLDELFTLAHGAINRVLAAANCYVALYDAASDTLQIPFCHDKFDQVASAQKLGKGLTAYVLRNGRPVFKTTELIQGLISRNEIVLVGTLPAAWLGVPLRTSAAIIGVLVVQDYEDRDAYSSRDLEFLTSVGAQIAVAIEGKRADEALKESEQRFRDLFYDAPVGYHEIDTEGKITCVNTTELVMLGYSSEEMIGHHVWEFIEAEEVARRTFAEKLASTTPLGTLQRRFRRKDGTFIEVQLDDRVLSDPSGRIIGIRATLQDITERKRAEEDLVESERRFRDLIENASDLIYTASFDGQFTSLNKSGERMTGYTRSQALQTNFFDIVSPRYLELIKEMTARKLASADETVYEVEIIKANGEPLLLEVSSRAVFKNGKPVGIQGIGRDITQRKQVEAELKLARDAAIESSRVKSEFLANMSHEIRTPMNGVIGMTGLLLDTELTAEQHDFTQTINASAEALMTVINDILDFSKIEAGKLHFEIRPFDLLATVEGVLDLLAQRAHAKRIEIASLVERNVPVGLRGDAGRLRQVLTNLIGNAVKFTDAGEVVVHVTMEQETTADVRLRFAISDTGIGINEIAQRRLFQAFVQADGSTTRKYGGTGLGLAIAKQLVELMGGEIGVDSTPGEGSTFWFTAPFEKQRGESVAVETEHADLAEIRVLVVDDNETNRRIVEHHLASWGLQSTSAASGVAALAVLRREAAAGKPLTLAILDMQMPEVDGLMLARQIKNDPLISSTRFLMLTSLGPGGDVEALRADGIAQCLTKPVKQSQLFDALVALVAAADQAAQPNKSLPASDNRVLPVTLPEPQSSHRGVRLLLAEDNPVNRKVALIQLEKIGYQVDAVNNGVEALAALAATPYPIVLMDCQMPEMDGYEATAEIRRREQGSARHTIVIAMTAHALQGERDRCLAIGMDDYLSKPVKLAALAAILERWDTSAGNPPEQLPRSSPEMRGAILDLTVLESFRDLQQVGHPDLLNELICLYLADTRTRLAQLLAAISEHDFSTAQRSLHSLKGSSTNLGVRGVADLCTKLELELGNESSAAVAATLVELEDEFALVQEALESQLLRPAHN